MAGLLRRGAPPLVIAHRGASSVAPENTLEAFTACWDAGGDWVETDVQPSADLVPVLMHDHTVDRTTTGAGSVRSLTSAQLAALDAGGWFGPSFRGTRVPTLHQLLSVLPARGRVLLEVKGPHTPAELAAELAVIGSTDTSAQVWVQSFDENVLHQLRRVRPHDWRGLLRDDLDADPVAVCRALGAHSYNPHVQALLGRPRIVEPLHAAGISLLPHTTDDPADWAKLTELGVDGIITNRPAELLAWEHSRVRVP